jgi:lysophospholipase L1-like esterase
LNLGVPGNTSVNGLKNVDEIPKDARLVIINLGGNDALKKIPEEVTENAIRSIISQVQQNGSIAMIISVRNGLLFGNFDYNYQKIADETGSLYMSDILKDIFGDEKYMSDQIHPNDLGYSIIADRIAEIIEDYI